MTTDNLATEPIDVHQATSIFANILEPKTNAAVEKAEEEPAQVEVEEVEEVEAEEEVEEVEEAEVEEEPKFTVKVDGKEIEVNLAELKNGYQRQADYTRKTTAVAEQARTVEAEIQKTQQERSQYIEKLNTYAQNLQTVVQQQSAIDWSNLLNTDPVEYLKQKHLFDQRQAALQQTQREQFDVQQRNEAEQAQNYQKHILTQRQLLEEQLPEWKDAKKAAKEIDQIRQYLIDNGMDDKQINGISDHRAIVLTRKAMLFDKLLKDAPEVTKKVERLPAKVVKPGSTEGSGNDARASAFRQLNKTGRLEDAAAVFATII